MTVEVRMFGSGLVALVDDADLPLVDAYRWSAHEYGGGLMYASARGRRPMLYMHRLITDAPPDREVDHRNGDGLDNQRHNLRLTTHALNLANQRHQTGRTSRFKGVSWFRPRSKWEAYITVNYKSRKLGYFGNEIAAALAYDSAALEAWGDHARLNFVHTEAVALLQGSAP